MNIDIENIVNPNLAAEGINYIEWASSFMPALEDAKKEAIESGILKKRRIGIVLVLEPKTACLAIALKDAGAEVFVYCDASSTKDSTAAALESLGIKVYARSDADNEMDELLLNKFLDEHIEFLIDDNAEATRYIHASRPEVIPFLKGIAEETTSGLRPIRVMDKEGVLKVPCLAVNDAKAKQLFDNVYGTGQSNVMTIIDVTNTQLQGKSVVVVGYGYVGKGVALTAHALGARVIVTEIDAIRALQAIYDGHTVAKLEDVCPSGDIFITATGIGYSLTGDHMRLMKDGAIVSVGGAGAPEVDLGGSNPVQRGEFIRAEVRKIPIDEERSVFLIADGTCSNCTAGEGNPVEIMDLSLTVQMRSVLYMVSNEGKLEISVQPVPSEIDDKTAKSVLRSLGANLDEPSPAQIQHMNSWHSEEY